MIKRNIKLLLITTIISNQLVLNAFAMDPSKDPSRQSIPTKSRLPPLPTLEELNIQHQAQTNILNQQQTPPIGLQIPQAPKTIPTKSTNKSLLPPLPIAKSLLPPPNKIPPSVVPSRAPISDEEDYSDEGHKFDFSPIDVEGDNREYQRMININTWKGGDPSSSDEE